MCKNLSIVRVLSLLIHWCRMLFINYMLGDVGRFAFLGHRNLSSFQVLPCVECSKETVPVDLRWQQCLTSTVSVTQLREANETQPIRSSKLFHFGPKKTFKFLYFHIVSCPGPVYQSKTPIDWDRKWLVSDGWSLFLNWGCPRSSRDSEAPKPKKQLMT